MPYLRLATRSENEATIQFENSFSKLVSGSPRQRNHNEELDSNYNYTDANGRVDISHRKVSIKK